MLWDVHVNVCRPVHVCVYVRMHQCASVCSKRMWQASTLQCVSHPAFDAPAQPHSLRTSWCKTGTSQTRAQTLSLSAPQLPWATSLISLARLNVRMHGRMMFHARHGMVAVPGYANNNNHLSWRHGLLRGLKKHRSLPPLQSSQRSPPG